jgi:hypothetical protein
MRIFFGDHTDSQSLQQITSSDQVIVNACESIPLQYASNVKLHDTFSSKINLTRLLTCYIGILALSDLLREAFIKPS